MATKMRGEGAFGAVFKGTVKATDAIRAVKRIPLPKAGPKKGPTCWKSFQIKIQVGEDGEKAGSGTKSDPRSRLPILLKPMVLHR